MLETIDRYSCRIAKQAIGTEEGLAWKAPLPFASAPLCSLGRGAAGIGFTFLQLAEFFGHAAYRELFEGALAYVESCRIGRALQWEDFRQAGKQAQGRIPPALYSICEGAAGIAPLFTARQGRRVCHPKAQLAPEAASFQWLLPRLIRSKDRTAGPGSDLLSSRSQLRREIFAHRYPKAMRCIGEAKDLAAFFEGSGLPVPIG